MCVFQVEPFAFQAAKQRLYLPTLAVYFNPLALFVTANHRQLPVGQTGRLKIVLLPIHYHRPQSFPFPCFQRPKVAIERLPCATFSGVMDKKGVKDCCRPYAARLYARSKPLNTKNAFFAAQNRSGKMAPKMANNVTDACPVTSVSAAGKSQIPTSFGSATAKASKPPHSLPGSTDAASKPSVVTSPKQPRKPMACCHKRLLTSSWTPPVSAASGVSWSSTTPEQTRLGSDSNRAGNQCALHAGGRCIARKRCRDTKHYL